jgi:hypothetical protein
MELVRQSFFKEEPVGDDAFLQHLDLTGNMYSSCPDLTKLNSHAEANNCTPEDLRKAFVDSCEVPVDDLELINALLNEMDEGLPLYYDEEGEFLQKFDCVEQRHAYEQHAYEQHAYEQHAYEQQTYEWLQQTSPRLQTVPTAQDSRVYPSHNVPRMPASPLVPRSRQTLPARLPRNSYLDRPVFAAEPSPLAREVTFDFPSPGPARRPLPFHQGMLSQRSQSCSDVFSLGEDSSPADSYSSSPVSRSPLSQTHRLMSDSLNSVASLTFTPSESEDYDSPFECEDRYNSTGSLTDSGCLDVNSLPYIRLSEGGSSVPVLHPICQMEDGTKLMAIPINPKTGKPKRRRRRKARSPVVPPPLLSNRSNTTLWEFFLELLLDPEHYSHLIMWVDREAGEFKIIDSEVVSVIWGLLKNKTGMKYDHMSRSIRYYYGKGILDKVPDKQLVYKFGPNSKWLSYERKSQGLDESRMPDSPIDVCGRTAKPKHFAVARIVPPIVRHDSIW